jgi:hypothetical protein
VAWARTFAPRRLPRQVAHRPALTERECLGVGAMTDQVPVTLNVYDLSQGMAKQFSPMILGKTVDGIWHTGIVFRSAEYYFGGGLCADPPGRTPYGAPVDRVDLGRTTKTADEFQAFLRSISPQFTMATYHLLDNNCNNFSDACAKFLLGAESGIPSYIIDLPREAMDSPMGSMLRPMIDSLQSGIRDQSAGHEINFGADGLTLSAPPAAHASTAAAASEMPTAIATCAAKPLLLTRTNVPPALAKLRELDADYPAAGSPSTDDTAPEVGPLLAAEMRASAGKAFPALDLLRMAASRDVESCTAVAAAVPRLLQRHVLDPATARPDCMMALRVAVSAFKFEAGARAVMAPAAVDTVVEAAAVALGHGHAAVTKTAAALAMNVAGAPRRHAGKVSPLSEEHNVRLVFAAVERARADGVSRAEDEAYALLGAIAVVVNGDADSCELVRTLDLDLAPFIDPDRCPDGKARAVALELDAILRRGRDRG